VLGRLAKALQSSPRPDRRARLSQAAVEMARRIDDPATLAEVLYERHMATWGPGNLEERLAMAAEVVRLAETGGDRVMVLRGREFLMADQLELGDLPALEQELEAYDRAAQELRQLHFSWHVPLFRAGQALLGGRLEEADRLAADGFRGLPGNHLYLYHLAVLAIVCHALDDQPRAARLYELLLPYAKRNVLVARVPLGTLGSASHHLGLLAAALARRDAAASHLQAAVRAHHRMGAPLLLARSRRELAAVRQA
jgi:tetratricopeptide (TPR) repeat protein